MFKWGARSLLLLFMTAVLMGAQHALAETRTIIEPRADNFIFYVDNSGSMMFDYEELKEDKSVVARDTLLQLNQDIPELDVNFGVYTYGPYEEYMSPSSYDESALAEAFESIPVEFEIFGRRTPMGRDLIQVSEKLAELQGDIAVIVVTDGESNIGPHPKKVMEEMYQEYGDRICFHFISLAQRPPKGTVSRDEHAFVEELAGINPCSVKIDADELQKDFVRADFIRDVFYTEREETVTPAPEPEPEPAPAVEPDEEVIVFSNIQFEFDKSVIRPQYAEILREAARQILDRTDPHVVVEGHTCNIGPADYNMGLSQRRADAVADFLVEQGVDQDAIETEAYGLTRPEFDNDTMEGRQLNRRVEMRLE
ncbi:OmpA family protein [Desulfonatronospira sp.]|uniref:OmpA family protein n=1 Tax=Desulfonatronospira sp. TaxID=1962951 RepID=UPI0025BAD2E2|nr:OmpA family protein [Desulfonatronospira sp.]